MSDNTFPQASETEQIPSVDAVVGVASVDIIENSQVEEEIDQNSITGDSEEIEEIPEFNEELTPDETSELSVKIAENSTEAEVQDDAGILTLEDQKMKAESAEEISPEDKPAANDADSLSDNSKDQIATDAKDQGEMSEIELRKRIETLEREIQKLADSASLSDKQMEEKGTELERCVEVQEEFSDWVEKRRASFAWQLLNRLKKQASDLALDEKLIKDFSESAPVIPEAFSESTRKWFMRKFWQNFTVSWGAVIILILINHYVDQLSTMMANSFGGRSFLKNGLDYFLRQAIGLSLPQVIAMIFGFSLLAFIALLFAYSRRNSEYQQLVAEESSRTLAMEKGIDSVRQARERIDSLHPQVPQIFEVLSVGLHQPWIVDDASLMFNGSIPDTSKLPSCVEVAVPTITQKSPKYEELVIKAMNQIQIPGWRAEAFKKVIQSVSESIGFGANDMAIRELEEDQRKSGKRQLVVNASTNTEPASLIGESLVEHFTRVVQEKVLPFSQPQVVSLRPDPLSGLQLDGSISMSGSSYELNWQEKLAEIADLASPWSALSFSDKGTANNRHQFVESMFIASERVPSREGVHKESAVNPGARPFEVAIRVDLSEWCKPDEVAVFSDFKPTQEQISRWEHGGSTHGTNLNSIEEQQQPISGSENLVV